MDYYETLKIGALLHDIGKWYKPLCNAEHHDECGEKFIEDYKHVFSMGIDIDCLKKLVKNHHKNGHENDDDNYKYLLEILKISDILSNGELITYENETSGNDYINLISIFENIHLPIEDDKTNTHNKKNMHLKSYNDYSKYSIVPLNVSEKKLFPIRKGEKKNREDKEEKKKILIKDVDEEYKKFVENDLNKNIKNFEDLYQFIQKYTWCIPSTYKKIKDTNYLPDVSLFDHLKTTCAIACCLYNNKNIDEEYIKTLLNNLNELNNKTSVEKNKYLEKINKTNDKDEKRELYNEMKLKVREIAMNYSNENPKLKDSVFSLIHGDISGVQDFIFNITSKGANKSLKGRSFYLDFLTELCAKYIVQKLELPITNILFYGGGHFYILSYNVDEETEEFKEKSNNEKSNAKNNISFNIEDFEKEINNILFEKFGADLYVAVGKVDLRPIDFLIDCMDDNSKIGIPHKWKECAEATSKRKMRKFEYKGMDLFKAGGNGGYVKRCSDCRREYEVKEGDEKCIYCLSFVKLTEKLKSFGNNNEKIKINEIKDLSIFKGFFENLEYTKKENMEKNENKNKLKYLKIRFENEEYYLPRDKGNLTIPYKIWSIAFPLKNKDNDEDSNKTDKKIMEFSELAEQAKERTGTNKIAILKMDVDNLGKIITKGLGDNATLSRLSTLSSMLTLFFTGYIPYLIKTGKTQVFNKNSGKFEEVEYKENIYLTYSGGDDTLIVGAWDTVWDLAKEINDKFKKFVCNNPDITLSAGVVLVSPKFEFKKAVELAEEELDRAKENEELIKIKEKENDKSKDKITENIEIKEKNSVCVFNSPLNWERVGYYKDDLENNIEKVLCGELNEFDESILERLFLNAVNASEKRRLLHIGQITANKLNEVVKEQDSTTLRLNIPAYWRVKYYLYRNFKDGEGLKKEVKFLERYIDTKVRNALNNLKPVGSENDDKPKINFNDLRISAKIIELKTR